MIEIIGYDRSVFRWINSGWSNPVLDAVMPLITRLFDTEVMWFWLLFLAFMSYIKFSEKNIKLTDKKQISIESIKRYFTYLIFIALIYAVNAGIYDAIKIIAARARPYIVQDAILRLSSGTVASLNHYCSFPSGHAANAFMTAVILSAIYSKGRVLFYLGAVIVALSRIYVGVHYPLDAAAGAFTGTTVTLLIIYFIRKYRKDK